MSIISEKLIQSVITIFNSHACPYCGQNIDCVIEESSNEVIWGIKSKCCEKGTNYVMEHIQEVREQALRERTNQVFSVLE